MLKLFLNSGETAVSEAGAMVAMEGQFDVKTESRGILRAVASKETIFQNTYTSQENNACLWLAPPLPGDIKYLELKGRGMVVNSTSYLAHHGDIKQEIVWRGMKGLMGGGGLFWLKISGHGGVWVNACGEILERDAKPGEKLTIDNTHLVCMDDTINYSIRRFGGLKSTIFGGEGFVFDVNGQGKIYLQSRSPSIYYTKTTS
jgi:uncharacterized protein (TIGR00266 family)